MNTIERKARKDHQCTLCFKPILKGSSYLYQRIAPWYHENNEGFSDYKAHKDCDQIFNEVGQDFDYAFPEDKSCWAEMVEWARI